MSLLCTCARKTSDSPSHSAKMSKIRPPSSTSSGGNRFGFGNKQPKNAGTPASKPLELTPMRSSPSHTTSGLAGGLALDPSALLSGNGDDNFGGYVPRNGIERTRPLSSIATVNHSNNMAGPTNNNVTSYDDTSTPPLAKPKPGIFSSFARKLASKRSNSANANNMNNSKSENSISGICRPGSTVGTPISRNNSTDSNASTRSNRSNKSSKSKLSYKGGSPLPLRSQASAKQAIRPGVEKSSHSTPASQKSKLVPKQAANSSTRSTQSSGESKPSRLSYPSSKLSSRSPNSLNNQYSHSHSGTGSKQSNNNNLTGEQREEDSNDAIDLCESIESECSAPVATVDTDLETSFSLQSAASADTSDRRARVGTGTSRLSESPSTHSGTGSSGGLMERRKPTIEITPLTKPDNLEPVESDSKVAKELNSDVPNVTKRYNTIRTRLSKYLNKLKLPSGSGATASVKPEFESLRWLITHIDHRNTTSSYMSNQQVDGDITTADGDITTVDEEDENENEDGEAPRPSKKLKTSSDSSKSAKTALSSGEMDISDETVCKSRLRTYTIDEEMISAIISEVHSLRQSMVELEHHLIGKQEHEEKMKAELRSKNEVISLLTSKLSHCTCQPQKNGYANGKRSEEEILSMAAVP